MSEFLEIRRLGHDAWMIPMYPRGPVIHVAAKAARAHTLAESLMSVRVFASAVRALLRAPYKTLRVMCAVLAGRMRHKLTNLAAFPKALWVAERARELGIDHIHAHWATTTASVALVASEITGIPWSFTAHRYDIVDDNLLRLKVSRARFARVISQAGVELAASAGVRSGALTRLPMGVQVPPEGGVGPRHDPFRLVCPARLSPVKGHEYLLRAIALMREPIELWLVGEGELRADIARMIGELNLSCVRMLGALPQERLLELYGRQEVDAVVLPSVDLGGGLQEGIPVALMEAMAYTVPVISTATGGIPELLRNGAGVLVRDKDPDALAQAIRGLSGDEEARRRIATAGRKRIVDEFSGQAVASAIIARIEEGGRA